MVIRRKGSDMNFRVSYKGMAQFVGRLDMANSYLKMHWGSVSRAYELGVKLQLVL